MGGACLRDHRHPWSAGGAGRAPVGGRRQGSLAGQPDVAGTKRASERILRSDRDSIALRLGVGQRYRQSDGESLRIGDPIGHGVHRRLANTLPVAHGHADADANAVAERQRESVELALARIS
ncbi:MAG TPA: hypothetical protein VGR77_09910 [Candidatus Dormibacteraeota bacterium]|nr:hypothetical protein [Candidatus Dormibacteraeota bacterium]